MIFIRLNHKIWQLITLTCWHRYSLSSKFRQGGGISANYTDIERVDDHGSCTMMGPANIMNKFTLLPREQHTAPMNYFFDGANASTMGRKTVSCKLSRSSESLRGIKISVTLSLSASARSLGYLNSRLGISFIQDESGSAAGSPMNCRPISSPHAFERMIPWLRPGNS